jgi:ribosomal subunit interface protein
VDILFKSRHTSLQERFRQHASMKLAKLEKLAQRAIRVDVEVSKEHSRQNGKSERVELTVKSRGPAIRAEAAADDRYAALDLALAKLEARLRRACDRRKERHAGGGHGAVRPVASANGHAPPPRRAEAARDAAADIPGQESLWPELKPALEVDADHDIPDRDMVPIEMEGDGPLVVRQKFHTASSMTLDQALFEMELVGHDFYLFHDKELGCASVVYRRCGYRYGVIRLVEQPVPEQSGQLVVT